jgi:hypothetical protein
MRRIPVAKQKAQLLEVSTFGPTPEKALSELKMAWKVVRDAYRGRARLLRYQR